MGKKINNIDNWNINVRITTFTRVGKNGTVAEPPHTPKRPLVPLSVSVKTPNVTDVHRRTHPTFFPCTYYPPHAPHKNQ